MSQGFVDTRCHDIVDGLHHFIVDTVSALCWFSGWHVELLATPYSRDDHQLRSWSAARPVNLGVLQVTQGFPECVLQDSWPRGERCDGCAAPQIAGAAATSQAVRGDSRERAGPHPETTQGRWLGLRTQIDSLRSQHPGLVPR